MRVWLGALSFALAGVLLLVLGTCQKEAEETGGATSVVVDPATATVERGATKVFSALVDGIKSGEVTWDIATSGKASDTTINSNGKLTVSTTEPLSTLLVRATSKVNPEVKATARVTTTGELAATVTGVTVTPVDPDVAKGSTRTFSATVEGTNSPSQKVTWSLVATGKKSGTMINSSGVLTVDAEEELKTLKVVATSVADKTKSGTTTVTVAPAASTVTGVTVTPSQLEVLRGGTAQFSAQVEGTGSPDQRVIWDIVESDRNSATVIDSSGILSVATGESRGTLTVRASSQLSLTVFGMAQVTLKTADPVVTRVTVSPTSAEIVRGDEGITFSAKVEGTGNPDQSVIWDIVESGRKAATTINASGYLSVAVDEELSALTVRARSVADNSKTGTATVQVTIPGPVNHVVTFEAPGGGFAANSGRSDLVVYVEHGKLLNRPEDPVRTGYVVNGWYRGTVEWDFDTFAVLEDVTLSVAWLETYMVTFETFGGTFINSLSVAKGRLVTQPADPTREHYTFGGWYKEESCVNAWNFARDTVQGATTLWAKWTANSYTVTFNPNGGTTPVPPSKTVSYDEPYGPLATATRSGYDLSGWYTAKDGGMEVREDTTVTLSAAQTLWAHWQTATYTVHFESNGGSDVPEQSVLHGHTLSRPIDPDRNNYTFSGWYKEAALTTAWNFSTDTVTGNLTLYAKWTAMHTVTFNANEGFPVPDAQVVLHGGKVSRPADPARSDYTFGGWYREAAFVNAWNFDSDTVSADMTLYAKWTKTIVLYTVSFDSTGGSGVPSQTVESGGKVTKPADPTRSGYTFNGWYKEAALTTAWNFASDTVTANLTLYAKWTENQAPTYTVSFASAGGSAVASQTVESGGKVTKPADPTRSGYTFAGWYKEAALTTAWNFTTDTVTANLTLYAKWTEIKPDPVLYTVSFESNGGSAISPQLVESGDKATKPTDPTRSNYTFNGWYREATWITPWNFDSDTVSANIKLYAKWTQQLCTVTFQSNGGSAVNTQTIMGGSLAVEPANPTRTGYVFGGWYSDAALTISWNFDEGIVREDITLYAKWRLFYTVTFDSTGGSAIAAREVESGFKVTRPEDDPTRLGYIFDGWYREETCITLWNFDSNTVNANTTLYAKWTAHTYTISFDAAGGDAPSFATKTVSYGAAYGELPTASWGIYTFLGWFTGSGSEVTESTIVTAAEDHTLYAHWVERHTVTFETNGGSEIAAQSVALAGTITRPNDPTKSGCIFAGWYRDATLLIAWDFERNAVIADISLWAKWSLLYYTITYDVAGGMALPQDLYTIENEITLPIPTRTGYTFNGWYDFSTGFEGERVTTVPQGSTGDKTFQAKWTLNTVTLDKNGGTGGTSTILPEVYMPMPSITRPTKTYYTFDGYWNSSYTIQYYTAAGASARTWDGLSTTLYAKWQANTFNLSAETGEGYGWSYAKGDKILIINDGASVAISGSTTTIRLRIDGGTSLIGLNTVSIDQSTGTFAPITLQGSSLTIVLFGETTLTAPVYHAAIDVPVSNSLTIKGSGSLNATGGTNAAGIGGGNSSIVSGTGSITIESGTITAKGGMMAAGIGGGTGNPGSVTITGGTITATGGSYGAGIGGGSGKAGGTITITGGTVTAEGGVLNSTGIGGGNGGAGGTITISGGTITAKGGEKGAGIGGAGSGGAGGTITISGGTITARGGNHGAGIGGGSGGAGGTINITGGTVSNATAGDAAAGIGGGYKGGAGTINISGGHGKATHSGIYAIGPGSSGSGGTFTLKGASTSFPTSSSYTW